MSSNQISITLRAPSQNQDHVILCQSDWSVLKLKQVIHDTYPGKPELSEQRLIYGGKYLCNHETLSSVLKVTNSRQIIHLVLVGSPYTETSKLTAKPIPTRNEGSDSVSFPYTELRQRRTANTSLTDSDARFAATQYGNWTPLYSNMPSTSTTNNHSIPPPATGNNQHSSPAAAAGTSLHSSPNLVSNSNQHSTPNRHSSPNRHSGSNHISNSNLLSNPNLPSSPPAAAGANQLQISLPTPPPYPYSSDQYAAMWEQYQQNMNKYMQYYADQQNASVLRNADDQLVQGDATVTNQTPPAAEPNRAPPARRPQENPRNDNLAMNAQGGFVAADDDVQHDWLDILFAMFRYCFFFSIIYFYSTVRRFILVAGLCLIFYLCRSGMFRAQRRQRFPDEAERRDNARGAEPPNTDDNNNENNPSQENNQPRLQRRPAPPSIFATAWCFIQTFFTSLIPQPTPVI